MNSQEETQPRKIITNRPNPNYVSNLIKSTSSNFFTFVPLNLLNQLTDLTNIYFILVSILQSIPAVSITNGIPTTLFPLSLVMLTVLIKDAYEEVNRYLKDKAENQRMVERLTDDRFEFTTCKGLMVGDVIRIRKEEFIPCDVLIVNTSDQYNRAFVETKGLDGENNLKLKTSYLSNRIGTKVIDEQSYRRSVQMEYSPPNRFFDNFEGWVDFDGKIPIEPSNLILRGCILKNVHEVIGICMYTGSDTKLVLNQVKFQPKRSKLMAQIDKKIIEVFIYQAMFALICSVFNTLLQSTYKDISKFIPISSFWTTAGTWWLLITYSIPISLIVTMEIVKLFQGGTLSSDSRCYSHLYNCYAAANNTSVNENLGQIRYVFTDKTGTLTKNNMIFRYFICGGMLFGDQQDQEYAKNTPVDIRASVRISDNRLLSRKDDPRLKQALKIICLCHEIHVQHEEGKIIYNSSSPDQIALINFAKLQEKELLRQHNNLIEIAQKSGNQRRIIKYQKLAFLEFNSVRRCMSVIIRDPQTKQIVLYTKGADSAVRQLLCPNEKDLEVTQTHIDNLSIKGMRTLMLGKKTISEQFFNEWIREYKQVKGMVGSKKEEAVNRCYEKIEKNLQLVGATAIEDQLQDDVSSTITDMRLAGMTFFILTGDKRETAISIGRSCGLVDRDALLVDIPTYDVGDEHGWQLKIKKLNEIKEKKVFLLNAQKIIPKILPTDQTICYRCTPANKKEIITLFKQKQSALTMAVGDGANDVSMITAADVGVGIKGREGTEAARVADFVVGEFKFIKLLTLYYGREWYRKNVQIINYSFWKNWFHVAATIAFGTFTFFSGVLIFNVNMYEYFNDFYTSCPIILWAVFDEQYSVKQSSECPYLYQPGITNSYFSQTAFLKNVGLSMLFGVTSLLLIINNVEGYVLDCYGTIGNMQLSGSILFSIIIIIANLRILVLTTGVKPCILVVSLASIAIFWLSLIIFSVLSLDQMANLRGQFYAGVIFTQIVLIFLCVLVEFGYTKYKQIHYRYKLMKSIKSVGDDLFEYILKGAK